MMPRRTFLLATAAAAFAAAGSTRAQELLMTQSTYANVNGNRIFYEVHGDGKPLILLHGGIQATAGFGPTIEALARRRRVIAVHLQGHGHTPDLDRPLRYEQLADDVAALVRELGLGKADFMGYSLGGGTALQVAIRHSTVVDRLVLVSTPMKHDGSYPEVLAAFEQMEANASLIAPNVAASPLGGLYPAVNWENLFRKVGELTKRPFDWSVHVPEIGARTMLVFADADSIRPEHMIEFYRLLGGGQRDAGLDGSLRPAAQLAVIPGATHYDIAANPLLSELALRFLAAA